MTLPLILETPRLRLPVITREQAVPVLAGERYPSFDPQFPRKDDLDAISLANGDSWGPRMIIRALDGLVVGTIGFFGPPIEATDGVEETEVGYGLVESARGRGVATEALTALLDHTDRLGVRIRASVEASNRASIRVLAKAGFTDLRGANEDGHLVMARPLTR